MKLPESVIQGMITHAKKVAPRESCGIIAGRAGEAVKLHKARNVSEDHGQYVLHPLDLRNIYAAMEKAGTSIFAFYHSHPHSEAYPSGDDVELALIGPAYVIVSIEDPDCAEVRAFYIAHGQITEELVEEN